LGNICILLDSKWN